MIQQAFAYASGLGESLDEVRAVMRDLRAAGVAILTLGQYLRPSRQHLSVERRTSGIAQVGLADVRDGCHDGLPGSHGAKGQGRRHAPAQDEEFVLSHCDNVQATGFVEHLKLPHYVDFQAELALLRQLRTEDRGRTTEGSPSSVVRRPLSETRAAE